MHPLGNEKVFSFEFVTYLIKWGFYQIVGSTDLFDNPIENRHVYKLIKSNHISHFLRVKHRYFNSVDPSIENRHVYKLIESNHISSFLHVRNGYFEYGILCF